MGDCAKVESRVDHTQSRGSLKETFGCLKPSTSYATGGDGFTAKMAGLTFVKHLSLGSSKSGTYFATARFSGSNQKGEKSMKIQVFVASTGAEVTSTTDLSAEVFRYNAVGTY